MRDPIVIRINIFYIGKLCRRVATRIAFFIADRERTRRTVTRHGYSVRIARLRYRHHRIITVFREFDARPAHSRDERSIGKIHSRFREDAPPEDALVERRLRDGVVVAIERAAQGNLRILVEADDGVVRVEANRRGLGIVGLHRVVVARVPGESRALRGASDGRASVDERDVRVEQGEFGIAVVADHVPIRIESFEDLRSCARAGP